MQMDAASFAATFGGPAGNGEQVSVMVSNHKCQEAPNEMQSLAVLPAGAHGVRKLTLFKNVVCIVGCNAVVTTNH